MFYQSNVETLQTVTTEIITPCLTKLGPWPLTFVEKGLYYIDVWFATIGSHVFYVYENNILKHKDILVVGTSGSPHIIYPNEERII